MINNLEELLQQALKKKNKNVVVVQPHNKETLTAVFEATKIGLANFYLVGDQNIISSILKELNCTFNFKIFHETDTNETIKKSINLVNDGTCSILMKGSVDTSTLMKAIFDPANNMRTGMLFSDVFIFELKNKKKLMMITDGGLNLNPDLQTKIGLIENALKVAKALGIETPKIALLSASEKVNPKLQSSIDAAEITKMNREGKIKGCIIDGPLALDLCVSEEAVVEKNIKSEVAGKADIIVAPNIETANSLAKSTQYFANLPHAQVIVGGKIPILIPSRADKCEEKVRTIALGVLMSL